MKFYTFTETFGKQLNWQVSSVLLGKSTKDKSRKHIEHFLSTSSRDASHQKCKRNHRTQREVSRNPPKRKDTASIYMRILFRIGLISFMHLLEDRSYLAHPCTPYLWSQNLCYFFFLAIPSACRSSRARDWTYATAVIRDTAVRTRILT